MKRALANDAEPMKGWMPATKLAQRNGKQRMTQLLAATAQKTDAGTPSDRHRSWRPSDMDAEMPERPRSAGTSEALLPLEHERHLVALLQDYLMKSPEALVFLDKRGAILYMNTQGEAQFSRWNRALRRDHASSHLPAALHPSLQQHGSTHLQHPAIDGLSAHLEATSDGFVLRLDDAQQGSGGALSAQALATLQKLSLSEQRVARLAVEGLRNDQIAQRLNRSRRTIEFQLRCTFQKLGISNRVQLSRLLR